jgi:hypothetical protein
MLEPMEHRSLGLLHKAAVTALWVGAVGSVSLLLYAGQRVGAPHFLLGLFAVWVVSPFAVLAVESRVSKRWSVLTQATLHGVTLVVTVLSLAIYGAVALGVQRPKTAVFVIVAPASWLLIAIAVATAAFKSRPSSSFRAKLPRA